MTTHRLANQDLDLILNETQTLWKEISNQHLFLTGGTGFFGCWLTESFLHINRTLQLNAHLTVLTRDPALPLLAGDVRTFSFPSGDFPFIIHAATEASVKQSTEQPLEMLTTIIDGTARVLDFAATHGARKLLLTSSGAVYGKQPPAITHTPEDYVGAPDPLNPANVYAVGKRASEQLCALNAHATGIEIKIARCFAFVGPHLPLDAHFAIGNFIRDALHNQPIAIAGDGTPLRSYLYAADLAIWLWTILFRAPSMQAFNVGSEEAINIRDLAHIVTATLDPALAIDIAKIPTPGATPAQYVPSTQRAQKLLGLKQHISLPEAIRRTAAWHTS